MFKRIISFVMCCCVIISCFSFFVSASSGLPDFTITGDEWNNAWPMIGNVNTNVCLTPGSDDSQLNFAWHCNLDDEVPIVKVSKSAGMDNAQSFTGAGTPADDGYSTSRVTATGLEPNTVYYYTYGNGSRIFGPYVYRTLASSSFKFWYVNDSEQPARNPRYFAGLADFQVFARCVCHRQSRQKACYAKALYQ